ncbi:MAG: endonuclease/exonuclease/phosphatase family protein, partial [Halocynthiibacter sp.]
MAQTLRVATYNTELDRRGPGLLLRDILRNDDAQITAVTDVIATVAPDILLIQRFDYDYDQRALVAFADLLRQKGVDYPYLFARQPNSGISTGIDMDGDGRLGRARDAQGYGQFAGQRGMALLSRYPIAEGARDFSTMLWRDLPGALLPTRNGAPFPSPEAQAVQRLSSVAHWEVPVLLPGGGLLRLLAWHATPPVFDGPEDMNGRRNHDEAAFWQLYLEGKLDVLPPDGPFLLLGDANLDPIDGNG